MTDRYTTSPGSGALAEPKKFAALPLCIDSTGHRFRLSPGTENPVCERCALVAVQK